MYVGILTTFHLFNYLCEHFLKLRVETLLIKYNYIKLINNKLIMAFEFTDANFKESALDNKGVSVVDFWAEWCGPCRMITPIIEELSSEYEGKATIGKINVDQNPKVSLDYGVRSIPTILILKNGEVVDKHVGVTTKAALEAKIQAHLASSEEEE